MSRPWTENELAILAQDSRDGTPRPVTALLLGRSVEAVRTRAHTEGFKLARRDRNAQTRLRERWLRLMPALKQSLVSDITAHG